MRRDVFSWENKKQGVSAEAVDMGGDGDWVAQVMENSGNGTQKNLAKKLPV